MTQLQPFVGADSLRKAQAIFLTNLEDTGKKSCYSPDLSIIPPTLQNLAGLLVFIITVFISVYWGKCVPQNLKCITLAQSVPAFLEKSGTTGHF